MRDGKPWLDHSSARTAPCADGGRIRYGGSAAEVTVLQRTARGSAPTQRRRTVAARRSEMPAEDHEDLRVEGGTGQSPQRFERERGARVGDQLEGRAEVDLGAAVAG